MAGGKYFCTSYALTQINFTLFLNSYILAAGGGQLPDVLQEAQIQVLELADCQERYSSTPYQVYDESICVFKLTDGDDHTGSCYVSIQTLAVACPSIGVEKYVSIQALAVAHPSIGVEKYVSIQVLAMTRPPVRLAPTVVLTHCDSKK